MSTKVDGEQYFSTGGNRSGFLLNRMIYKGNVWGIEKDKGLLLL